MLVVRDVSMSSRFYQQALAAESGHGGEEYKQIVSDGEILLQLHALDVEDHHAPSRSRRAVWQRCPPLV